MPRGAEAKVRRRQRRKEADDVVNEMFESTTNATTATDQHPPLPSPPRKSKFVDNDIATSDDDDDNDDDDNLPKKKNKARKAMSAHAAAAKAGGGGGIKTTPLILLVLMVGTTLLPAFIYAGDYLSAFLAKSNVLGNIGFRMGIGAVPKKRVLSFYEKHAPEKLDDVPSILAKHYGDYPKLIKKLERKYGDYGYFLGWEDDEAPSKLAMEKLQETYNVWLQKYWNRHAPQILKTGARNIRYNLTFLYKQFRKIWKKHAWPVLEPIFGVPDGAAAQKRKDAAEARKRQAARQKATGSSSTRRKNTEFRDDEE